MHRNTHEDERGIKSILVSAAWAINEELVGAAADFVLDALLLALLVDTEVAKNAQAEFGDLWVLVIELFFNFSSIKNLTDLLNKAEVR